MYFFHLGKDEEVAGVRDFGNPVCQATGQLGAALHDLADVCRDIGHDRKAVRENVPLPGVIGGLGVFGGAGMDAGHLAFWHGV